MNLTGLLRIAFRWKKLGLCVFALTATVGLISAFLWPLKYVAQVTIEREPAKISLRPIESEFDVTRFTSEDQRTLTFLKSRYLLQEWLKAIGIQPRNAKARERALKKLKRSLIGKPINFTDLYLISVKAESPSEAVRRLDLLVQLFEDWDTASVKEDAERLTTLLNRRLAAVGSGLEMDRNEIKKSKLSGALNLSGSVIESGIEMRLKARQELYNELTNELEKTGRQLDPANTIRVRRVIPIDVSEIPDKSRGLLVVLALMGSLFASLTIVFLREWQSRKIFRAGDVYKHTGIHLVMTIPESKNSSLNEFDAPVALSPLLEAISQTLKTKSGVIVQLISPDQGDGKTAVCEWLRECSAGLGWRVLIVKAESGSTEWLKELEQVQSDKTGHDVILLELPSPAYSLIGSNLTKIADINCVVLGAARTSSDVLRKLTEQLKRFPQQISFLVLNRYVDPLPASLRN